MNSMLIVSFLVILNLHGFGQRLPDELRLHPNGIEFSYENTKEKKCQPFLNIRDSVSYFYKCYNDTIQKKQIVKRSDSILINKIRSIITFDFIIELNECCQNIHCWDSDNIYWIFKKENDRIEYIFIDKRWVHKTKCGNDLLLQLIKEFKTLNKKY